MFVLLSKLLDLLLTPLAWSLLLLLAAALLRARTRLAWSLAALAVAVLLVFSCEQVADRMVRHVEAGAVRTERPEVTYDAVVILGGVVDAAATRATGVTQLYGSVERLLDGWEVVRTGHARQLLYSCGVVEPQPGDEPESLQAERLLRAWGVPAERIVVETASRNTRENAVEVARIARERGWTRLLVVTSAFHVRRSAGCFRAVGLPVDFRPVDYRGGDGRGLGWLPRAQSLAKSTEMLRELGGQVVYRVMGYGVE